MDVIDEHAVAAFSVDAADIVAVAVVVAVFFYGTTCGFVLHLLVLI